MPTSDEIDNFIKQLAHYKKSVRDEAEMELRQLGVEAIPNYLYSVRQERKKFLRNRTIARCVGLLLILPFVAAVAVCWDLLRSDDTHAHVAPMLLAISIVPAAVGWTLKVFFDAPSMRLEKIYSMISEIHDPRTLGVLLDAVAIDRSISFSEYQAILMSILPRVTPEIWAHMTPKQYNGFLKLLLRRSCTYLRFDEHFTLVCLRTLEQVGGMEAVSSVENIVKHGKNEKARQAAQECLPYLLTRRDEQSTRQTLLRASEATDGKEELLRVPAQTYLSESEQLLRVPHGEE